MCQAVTILILITLHAPTPPTTLTLPILTLPRALIPFTHSNVAVHPTAWPARMVVDYEFLSTVNVECISFERALS